MSRLTLSFKGRTLKVFPVLAGEMLIGSDPQCAIHIDSLAVHAQHARLHTEGNATTVQDLGSPDGTFLNQEKLEDERPLADGDIVRIGKHTLSYRFEALPEFEAEPLAPPPAAPDPFTPDSPALPRSAWLQILTGHNLGKTLSLNRALTNLGKPGLARAVIARRNDGYFLSHLEGREPPSVGSRPIGEHAHPLEDGDIIQIGNVKMQFYYE